MEKYASELIPVLIEVIIASNPSAVKYPSNQAYMLRHICLLFFLFSSIPSILENLINDTRYKVSKTWNQILALSEYADVYLQIVDVLCMLLDGTVMEIQVNTLAVVANFVETLDGARKICENKKLLQVCFLPLLSLSLSLFCAKAFDKSILYLSYLSILLVFTHIFLFLCSRYWNHLAVAK